MSPHQMIYPEKRPTKFKFVMNPYPYMRLSSCAFCNKKTGQRKLPLLIHVDPHHLIALNYTCRYCPSCDLLIAHKHAIENNLFVLFQDMAPDAIGNDYLVLGTMDKKVWKEGRTTPLPAPKMLEHLHVFETCYNELRHRQRRWYPANLEPPIVEPPPSKEWVK